MNKCAKCHEWFLHADVRVAVGDKIFHRRCTDENISSHKVVPPPPPLKTGTQPIVQNTQNKAVLPHPQLGDIPVAVDSNGKWCIHLLTQCFYLCCLACLSTSWIFINHMGL
jgi:hypothetical protein